LIYRGDHAVIPCEYENTSREAVGGAPL